MHTYIKVLLLNLQNNLVHLRLIFLFYFVFKMSSVPGLYQLMCKYIMSKDNERKAFKAHLGPGGWN